MTDRAPDLPWSDLTDRELACLRAAASHKRSKQIAVELGLQPGTVDTYIARAVRKLGMTDRASALRAIEALDASLSENSRSRFSHVEPVRSFSLSDLGRLPWPFATRTRPRKDFSRAETLIAIIFAAVIMMTVFAFYLVAILLIDRR